MKLELVDDPRVEEIVSAIKASRKYGVTLEETVRSLAAQAIRQHSKQKHALKAVRRRLHSIMAPYLGDPDYEEAARRLTAAFRSGNEDEIRDVCYDCLSAHLSTRERLPILAEFYARIFEITGKPSSMLDIASGLNPLAFPWMGLSQPVNIHAYDIHEPRIRFINHYFALQELPQLGRLQDIALRFPQEKADLALFLKEMPRFERNYGGRGAALLDALRVRHIVVSFPTVSTHGGRNLTNRYRDYFQDLLADRRWSVSELLFEGELVFCVDKAPVNPGQDKD